VRVAFDGEFYRLPPSGIGGYVRYLVPALRSADSTVELTVVEPQWNHSSNFVANTRLPFPGRRLQRASWEALGFGLAARNLHPDLLHVPSFAAPLVARTPLVVTIHDVIPLVLPAYRSSRAMRAHLALMRRTVRNAAIVIAPSNSAAEEISTELGIPRAKIRVTLEAADPACVPARDRAAIEPVLHRFGITGPYIFNAGGLDVRKNVPMLIDAFAQLRSRTDSPLQLVIAGAPHSDNPTVFPPISPLVERLGLERFVIMTGRVSEVDKIALFQGADLYVTPSMHEGFGLTALEAMACGIPTITANASSFPEIVGDAGLLAELDADSMAASMELVLSNAALATELRSKGLARAAEFSWQRTAKQTLDVYHEVLADQRYQSRTDQRR
jgi:glycosyltransferase involved in cell wall biosynthesis